MENVLFSLINLILFIEGNNFGFSLGLKEIR